MEPIKTNWESIGLSNDFLFGKIMRKPALCKRMLEIILGVKINRLEYMGGRPSEHEFVKKLSQEVALAKQNKEWRREYMTLLMRNQENIEKGREEGRQEEESLFAELTHRLLKDKRYNDLEKGTTNPEYCKELYREYHIL